MGKPRLLLFPAYSQLEWVIRPQLEEWADVATFDAPGVAKEPPPPTYDDMAIAERAAAEFQRTGWESCVVAADEYSIASALRFASARPEAVDGLALGHACLNFRPDGAPAAVNPEVRSAFAQVAQADDRTFMRHITQITQGFYGEELADRMLTQMSPGAARAYVCTSIEDPGDWIAPALRELDKPMLFAEHDPCLLFTKEGFEAAVAAFPQAMTVSCTEKPTTSPAFAEALREFCESRVRAPAQG
jgi:pimeloyl-ACP methyl ester carboxylesterase